MLQSIGWPVRRMKEVLQFLAAVAQSEPSGILSKLDEQVTALGAFLSSFPGLPVQTALAQLSGETLFFWRRHQYEASALNN